jgi:small-conductance mechanosensitive channel
MKTSQRILLASLIVLLLASIAGYVLTREAASPLGGSRSGQTGSERASPVDLRPLRTAQELAAIASMPREQRFAREARRLADYEVDLAFAAALREAKAQTSSPTPEIRGIQTRLYAAQERLQKDQQRIAQLSADFAKATGPRKDNLDDELQLAKAQVKLSQDEVDDAEHDLIRAGGDPQARIQRMFQRHEAAEHKESENPPVQTATVADESRGLVARLSEWVALYQKQQLLQQARQAAETNAAALTEKHDELEARISAELRNAPAVAKRPAPPSSGQPEAGLRRTREETAALISSTKSLAENRQALSEFGTRIDNEKELADVYSGWSGVVSARQKSVLHQLFLGLLIIFLIALAGFLFASGIDHLLARTALEKRQRHTLRSVTRVVLQVVVVLFVLLVVFGRPNQIATVIGLAGAGLTIALKDFIVGFFGWFVLMGKNGMRLGDWVEIKGVSGEVVEIGLFHTVLLETGNWADAGHPTGRRVTFVNSFAIEGHYFNFSTSGQWLWDELHFVLPRGRDPYPVVEEIQKIVSKETEENARLAEQEWQRVARSKGLSAFTATSAFNLRPVHDGIEVVIRYITCANERHQQRARLYHEVISLLGRRHIAASTSTEPPSQPAGDTD